jgi:hypothetical protein
MVPAGSVSELQLDVDPLSLRALLLPYSTTIKYRLKRCVGELLFTLCDEQGQRMISSSHACLPHRNPLLLGSDF